MPRAVVSLVLGFLILTGSGAQGLGPAVPRWSLSGPAEVIPGRPFTVQAEVRLPPGYYQDAGSPFLLWEPDFPAEVTGQTSGAPAVRDGKASYTGTFLLYRTLVLPADTPVGDRILKFSAGWQICQVDGVCLLPGEQTLGLPVKVASTATGGTDILMALVGAFVGGLLLNFMPCVFPVLALKALGLASAAGLTRVRRRQEALAFAGGGLLAVTALGLATAAATAWGQRLDWGFPFQQPAFVWALAAAFGFLTLPLLGVGRGWSPFTLTHPARGGLWSKAGSGAFLLLAAAPCTAPLLGPALGFALARPPEEIPFYFLAIGLGLVLPLLVLQAFPDWGRHLPRPGRWLVVVERTAGVLLAATTGYLVWVLLTLAGTGALPSLGFLGAAGLGVGIAFLVKTERLGRWLRRGSGALVLTGLVFSLAAVPPAGPPAPTSGWAAFSPEALETARKSGPVLVDATAAWCATCQVNEWAVLNRPDVTALLDGRGVVRLRADYTRPDPDIRRWLAEVGRAGLPVYALYRPGQPVYLFPELLTDDNFTRALPALLGP